MGKKIGGLGKGLEALFEDNATEANKAVAIKINDIEPDPLQPRKNFDQDALEELAESVRTHGLLQPIIVRPTANGRYIIVAGERRWRASRMAGLEELPVIIKEMNEKEAAEIALVENLQREDLNPIEEARGYKNLIESFGLSQEQTAERVGKSRSAVANSLRLLTLPDDVVVHIEEGRVSPGHARALLSMEDETTRNRALEEILKGKMTVREAESFATVHKTKKNPKVKKFAKDGGDKFYAEMEMAAKEELRRRVRINAKNDDKGTVEIEFYSKEDLTDILYRLANKPKY
ncbi:MAG: ParB/RepB/Spo0J family partition protein [Oscillospiraceae bacterium]|nr:ParB/RepB/Spo0J family partition protein [Oscillospiraceae bacterium]